MKPSGAVRPLAVTDYTVASALGSGREATLAALRESRTGLARRPDTAFLHGDFEAEAQAQAQAGGWLGVVDAIDAVELPPSLAAWDCRNNRLAELALRSDAFAASVDRAAARWGAKRIGVFVGTSTSGILHTELAYRRRSGHGALPGWLDYEHTHNTASSARYVRAALGLAGPAFVVSTACSSSAKVFGNAERMIDAGLIDAAVVGGVDSLCGTTVYGFRSLELVSDDICRPWDAGRTGLSLGEGAAFVLLEREPRQRLSALLLGCGESSDGHHMSAPHPEGAGAAAAMRSAFEQAGLEPSQIDYLNLHGTATPGNDAAEDRAVRAVFGDWAESLLAGSTKGATGHTLGAAGAVEAAIVLLALENGFVPCNLNLQRPDPALGLAVLREPRAARLRHVASNSFGFGGSNACLVFGAAA